MTPPEGAKPAPLVTIGISTYNRLALTFPEALRSALAQTYPYVEVVVCDNASTDGTAAYVREQRDDRLRYLRHPANIGPNANFNACLEQARGTYFLLLHDDDVLDPTFAERAMLALDGREPGVLLGGVRLIDAEGRGEGTAAPPPPDLGPGDLFLHWFGRRFSFYFCSTLFHTQRLRDAGGFGTPENLFQDVVAIARLTSRFGYVSVPGIVASFRRHGANHGAASRALSWARDAAHLLDVLCDELPNDAERLRTAGAKYLTQTSYRYAAAESSSHERRRAYQDIYARFGHAYAPWRFVVDVHRRRLKRRVGHWLRSVGVLRRKVV